LKLGKQGWRSRPARMPRTGKARPPMIRLACPTCGEHLKAPDRGAGQKVSCPRCGRRLLIPPLVSAPAQVQNKTMLGQLLPASRTLRVLFRRGESRGLLPPPNRFDSFTARRTQPEECGAIVRRHSIAPRRVHFITAHRTKGSRGYGLLLFLGLLFLSLKAFDAILAIDGLERCALCFRQTENLVGENRTPNPQRGFRPPPALRALFRLHGLSRRFRRTVT
jgi:DNA-directed RNA polymerase subunit RPC12/RpoP